MSSRNTLTERFLAAWDRHHPGDRELLTAARESDLLQTAYGGRLLTRPAFLDGPEHDRLAADMRAVHALLVSLPDRLFDGDLGAFAGATGMTGPQTDAVRRSVTGAPTALGRADFYADATGFRLLEFNLGSTVGGLDNAELNRAFLRHPLVSEFVWAHRLGYRDTLQDMVDTMLAECSTDGLPERPVVALADWPTSFPSLRRRLGFLAERMSPMGIDARPCHVGQLTARRDGVFLDGTRVDIVYRLFMIEDLVDADSLSVVEPVLRAAEAGTVALFTALDAELYGSKGALAMLSDERYRAAFGPAERELLDRFLPWTRPLRPGTVAVGSETVAAVEYAREHRDDLVLKPTLLHGGSGVVCGWTVDDSTWRKHLDDAMDGPFVLQQRVRPVPELFPDEDAASLRPWVLNWGAFLVRAGYGGAFLRGVTDAEVGVVGMGVGASAACCFQPG